MKLQITPATGRLGVLMVGNGAVTTTFAAGVEAAKRGIAPPFGSLTQMQRIRLGKRDEKRFPLIREVVPLAVLEDIVIGTFDPLFDDGLVAARHAKVLESHLIDQLSEQLASLKPMPAVFDQQFVKRINGENVKSYRNKMEAAEQVMDDIERFKTDNGCSRVVMIFAASTESYLEPKLVHKSLGAFEAGLYDNDPDISPSMIYAYAAIKTGTPFANGTPGLCLEIPALLKLAHDFQVPICGKDFKTGQTLLKTAIAPMFAARMLRMDGWYSTNILGNRDGAVLDEPENFKSKEVSKGSVLDTILPGERYPDLYGEYPHIVRINYYPPAGDAKNGWDRIDFSGWLGYPMQIKIDFQCRDSILAAPVVLDLALFLDLAKRGGLSGVQEWLSFYFKVPQTLPGLYPENDLYIQHRKLKNNLRSMIGEELITHVGDDYDD